MVSFDGGYESANGHSEADAGVDRGLLDLFGLVWRRKGLIAFGLFLGLGLGTLYFFQATPMYESSVEILVVPKDADLRGPRVRRVPTTCKILRPAKTRWPRTSNSSEPKVITSAIEHASLDQLPDHRRRRSRKVVIPSSTSAAASTCLVVGRARPKTRACCWQLTQHFPSRRRNDILDAIVRVYTAFLGQHV